MLNLGLLWGLLCGIPVSGDAKFDLQYHFLWSVCDSSAPFFLLKLLFKTFKSFHPSAGVGSLLNSHPMLFALWWVFGCCMSSRVDHNLLSSFAISTISILIDSVFLVLLVDIPIIKLCLGIPFLLISRFWTRNFNWKSSYLFFRCGVSWCLGATKVRLNPHPSIEELSSFDMEALTLFISKQLRRCHLYIQEHHWVTFASGRRILNEEVPFASPGNTPFHFL